MGGDWRLCGLDAWVEPVEQSLGNHPDGAGLYDISGDTGAAPAVIRRVLAWLDNQRSPGDRRRPAPVPAAHRPARATRNQGGIGDD